MFLVSKSLVESLHWVLNVTICSLHGPLLSLGLTCMVSFLRDKVEKKPMLVFEIEKVMNLYFV